MKKVKNKMLEEEEWKEKILREYTFTKDERENLRSLKVSGQYTIVLLYG